MCGVVHHPQFTARVLSKPYNPRRADVIGVYVDRRLVNFVELNSGKRELPIWNGLRELRQELGQFRSG